MKKQATFTALALATAMTATAAQADDIKVSGKVFADYGTSTKTGSNDTSGGTISRTYLTAKKTIDDTWSAKVTLDSALNSSKTSGKKSEVFLKTAQLTGKFSDAVNVKIGLIGTPWIGYSDSLGKHRHVTKSYADTQGIDSSADAGIGIFGKAGMVSYDIVNVNGGGYGNVAKTDATDLNARIGIKPLKGLTVDLGYRSGYLGKGKAVDKTTLTQTLVTYGKVINDLSYRAALNLINNKQGSVTEKGQEMWIWVRQGEFGGYLRSENTDFDNAALAKESRTLISLDYYAAKGVIISLVSDSTKNAKGVDGTDISKTGLFTQFAF